MATSGTQKREGILTGFSHSFMRWLNGTSALWPPRAKDWSSYGVQSVMAARSREQKLSDRLQAQSQEQDWQGQGERYISTLREILEPLASVPGAKIAADFLRTVGVAFRKEFIDGGRQLTTVSGRKSKNSVPISDVVGTKPAASVKEIVSQPRPTTSARPGETLLAMECHDALRSYIGMIAAGRMTDAFRDGWSDLRFMMSNIMVGDDLSSTNLSRDYAVYRNEGYIGIAVGRVQGTKEQTLEAALRTLRSSGLKIRGLPETLSMQQLSNLFLYDEDMPIGAPVLLRGRSLIRAAKVSPTLAVDKLEAAFAQSAAKQLKQAQAELPKAQTTKRKEYLQAEVARCQSLLKGASYFDNIRNERQADLESRKQKIEERQADISFQKNAAINNNNGFGLDEDDPFISAGISSHEDLTPDNTFIRFVEGMPLVYQNSTDFDGAIKEEWRSDVIDLARLPVGKYRVQNSHGYPDGTLSVDARGCVERQGHFTASEADVLVKKHKNTLKPKPEVKNPQAETSNENHQTPSGDSLRNNSFG